MAFAATLLLTACVNDSTDFLTLLNIDEQLRTVEIKSIEFNTEPYDTPEDASAIPADDNDYVENSTFESTIYIDYSDDNATVSGDISDANITMVGAHVIVVSHTKNVSYVLSGSTSNGSFKIYSKNKFMLTLNGVDITNPTGAAINNQGEFGAGGVGTKTMYVVLPEGTVNTLTDGSVYVFSGGEQMKGTFFSEGQVVFSGAGSLTVNGNYKNGIASDDYVKFRPGVNIAVNCTAASGHGVKANDGIYILGGTLNIGVAGSAAKGMNSEARIYIEGGRTTVITTGDPLVELTDTSSCAGLKSDSTLYVYGGIVNLKSTGEGGKGVNVTEGLVMAGGELNVVTTGIKDNSSPKGIKCGKDDSFLPGDMTVSGGSIYCYSANSDALDIKGTRTIAENYLLLNETDNFFELRY